MSAPAGGRVGPLRSAATADGEALRAVPRRDVGVRNGRLTAGGARVERVATLARRGCGSRRRWGRSVEDEAQRGAFLRGAAGARRALHDTHSGGLGPGGGEEAQVLAQDIRSTWIPNGLLCAAPHRRLGVGAPPVSANPRRRQVMGRCCLAVAVRDRQRQRARTRDALESARRRTACRHARGRRSMIEP